MEFSTTFITDLYTRYNYYKELGDKTIAQLTEAQIHFKPSAQSNSIAIIIQHLYGNMMSRFTNILTEDGEKEWRKRDAEFEPMELSKQDVVDLWNTGWSLVLHTIKQLQPADLNATITIRSQPLTVYDALLRQLAHYPYHIGQIVLLAKMQKDASWINLSVPKGESKAYEQAVKEGTINGSAKTDKV
jgi:hypothetical protein